MAFTKYETLLAFVKHLGVNIAIDNYKSRRSLQDLLGSLADVVEEEVIQKLQSAPFYSIMIDETSTITLENTLIIYATYFDERSKRSHHAFLKLLQLCDRTSDGITKCILSYLKSKKLDIGKLIGFASDGASTMLGKDNGVARQLTNLNPFIINSHCVAHKLSLANVDSFVQIEEFKLFESIIKQIYRFFRRSSKRYEELSAFQTVLQEKQLKVVGFSAVRWLSIYDNVLRVKQNYKSMVCTFRQEWDYEKNIEAEALFNHMRTETFLYLLYLLLDVMNVLKPLINIFQKDELNYAMLDILISTTIDSIRVKLADKADISSSWSADEKTLKDRGIILKKSAGDFSQYLSIRGRFLSSLVKNIEDRFPQTKLLSALRIFSPSEYKKLALQSKAKLE